MTIAKLIAWLIQLLRAKPVSAADDEGVRAWVVKAIEFLKWIASQTPIESDDAVLAVLDRIVSDDAAWDAAWRFISLFLAGEAVYGADEADAKRLTTVTGLDWAKVVEILRTIAELLRVILNK